MNSQINDKTSIDYLHISPYGDVSCVNEICKRTQNWYFYDENFTIHFKNRKSNVFTYTKFLCLLAKFS